MLKFYPSLEGERERAEAIPSPSSEGEIFLLIILMQFVFKRAEAIGARYKFLIGIFFVGGNLNDFRFVYRRMHFGVCQSRNGYRALLLWLLYYYNLSDGLTHCHR